MSSLAVLVVPLFLLQGATAGISKVSDVSPATKVPVSPVTKVPVSPVTKVPVSPVTKVPVSPVTVTVGPPVSTVTVGPPVSTVTVGPPVTKVVPVMVPLTPEELKGLSYFLMDQVNDGIKNFNLANNASQIELADIDDSYSNGTDLYEWYATGGKLLTSGIDLIPNVQNLTMEVSGVEETNKAVHLVQFAFSISLKNPVIEYDYFDLEFSGGNDPDGSRRAAHGVERTNSTTIKTNLGAISVGVIGNQFDIQLSIVHVYNGQAGSPICVATINNITVTDFVVGFITVQKDSLMKPVVEELANLIETQLVEDTQVIQIIEQTINQTYRAFIPFCDYAQPEEFQKALGVLGL